MDKEKMNARELTEKELTQVSGGIGEVVSQSGSTFEEKYFAVGPCGLKQQIHADTNKCRNRHCCPNKKARRTCQYG